jgi:hypothetical protein
MTTLARRVALAATSFALALVLALAAGCGGSDHGHHHETIPATIFVVNDSPYFAVFSVDDCFTYQTDWLSPGEALWIEIDWSVDRGGLPGTLLPCFYFQSFDGTVEGHVGYGPIWVDEGDVETIVFG